MKFLSCERISQHKYKTPEGYLVCTDAILARTGKQTYKRREVFGDSCKDAENEVEIDRPAEEVFSDKTLASFENKPLTIEHPDEDVNTGNYRDLAVGFTRDIKRGKDNGQDVMLGTIVITDSEAIEAVESGEMTDLSCGYDCDIVDEDNPCQRNIRGNHVALCRQGRAGIARIVDSKIDDAPDLSGLYKNNDNDAIKVTRNGFSYDVQFGEDSIFNNGWSYSRSYDSAHLSSYLRQNRLIKVSKLNYLKDSIKDDKLQRGKTYVTSGGATLKITDFTCEFSDYNGEASIMIWYDYVSASGKKRGSGKTDAHNFWKMLTDKSMTGDSVKDNLELPEDEDSTFMYRDAYGKEIIVTNWDGRNVFLVEYDGTEQQMNRRDIEYYLDRKGARFSRVLRDSVKDAKIVEVENGKKLVQVGKAGAHYAIENHGLWWIMHRGKTISRHETKEDAKRTLEEYAMRDSVKDGKLVEVPPSTISAFEGKVQGANINIDSKGKTWSGRLHYQLSYDASKASFDTFVKELERLESWLESIDIPVTFSANTDGKRHTAGFDIDKQWVKDSVKDSYHQIDMTDQWGGTRSIIVKASSFDEAKKKAEKAHPEWKYKNAWQSSEADFEGAKRRYGLYIDSTQDVDTYEEETKNLKKQAKKEMNDDWSGSYEGYIFSYVSNGDYFMLTSPTGKTYKVNGDADPKQAIRTLKYLNKDSMKDSKEDILQKIRTTQIREGDTFEIRDGQYLVQIQNVGKQTIEFKGNNWRVGHASIKESSYAWGRIWKNGTLVFNESDALNIVRDKMIQFIKTVRDSVKDERLSPMTYKKLKELGVKPEQWQKWTQEQANEFIRNKSGKKGEMSKKAEEQKTSEKSSSAQKSKNDFNIENYKTIEKELNDIGGLFENVNLHSIVDRGDGSKYLRFTSKAQAPEQVMKKAIFELDDKYFSKYGLKIVNNRKFKPHMLYVDGRYQFDMVLE